MVNYTFAYEGFLSKSSLRQEPDWPHHDCPIACVIAQQYSSVTSSLTVLSFEQVKL
jgi:hypothetical protein